MTTFCVISYLKISAVFKWFTYTYEKFFTFLVVLFIFYYTFVK